MNRLGMPKAGYILQKTCCLACWKLWKLFLHFTNSIMYMYFDATFRIIKLKFETVACICQEQLYKFFMSKSPPIYVKMEIVTSIFLII